MVKNTKDLFAAVAKGMSAHEAILGDEVIQNFDIPSGTVEANDPINLDIYRDEGYTQYNFTKKYRNRLKLPNSNIEAINDYLNKRTRSYDGAYEICPKCKRAVRTLGNDGAFCKFCGQLLYDDCEEKLPLGDNIRTARILAGLTQTEMAKKCSISTSKVCLFEKGGQVPTLQNIKDIAKACDCSPNRFFNQPHHRDNLKPKPVIVKKVDDGYECKDDVMHDYITVCPTCKEEIDPTVGEALSQGLPFFETAMIRSHGNDGLFCKHCGTGIVRPYKRDEEKEFRTYLYIIKRAAHKLHINC